MWYLIYPHKEFFFLPSSTVEVRGQGQLQSIIQNFGALLKDTLAVWMLGNTQAAVTAGATGEERLCRETLPPELTPRLFSQQELHRSLIQDTVIFITLRLICYCVWFSFSFPQTASSPQCCATCVTAEFAQQS